MAKRDKLGLGQVGRLGSGDTLMEMAKGWVEGRTMGQSRGQKWPRRPAGGGDLDHHGG